MPSASVINENGDIAIGSEGIPQRIPRKNNMTTTTTDFKAKVKTIIDELKSVCASYGLGNDGNEFKIITQVFLYKFLNDKFIHEVKKLDKEIANAEDWEAALRGKSEEDYQFLLLQLESGNRLTELNALFRIPQCRIVTIHGSTQCAPCNTEARAIQTR